MKIKYLYLDDEIIEETQSIKELLELENKNLKIFIETPLSFAKQISELKKTAFDGLMLDLRLDIFKNKEEKAEYRALTLAQEIRTRSTEGIWDEFPIVVCSTDSKLKRSYDKNIIGHDVFDIKYLKSEELIENSEKVATELVSLAKGYKIISQIKNKKKSTRLSDFFSLTEKELELIDDRLINYFYSTSGELPVHEYARFILKEVILKRSLLVEKEVLFARLGIDSSSPDTELKRLFAAIDKYKYRGPFSDGWERWWWPLINKWWYTIFKNQPGLVNTDAETRVSILNKKLKSKLLFSKPIAKGYSSRFWTVCEYYKRPVDPFDSFIIDYGYEPLPWQERLYISMKASLLPDAKVEGLLIHPIEKKRFEEFKKSVK